MSTVATQDPYPLVILLRNPFVPADREVFNVPVNSSIAQWLHAQDAAVCTAVSSQPTICLKSGQPVLRADWAVTKIEGAIIFVALPQGGGGGGGKNPLRTVLMIAVMVVANVYGGPLASALGFSGSLGTAVASAGIALAGSVLVNALVPLPTPNVPTAGSLNSPSPTYSLQAQGNYARLTQPIPVVYGHHLVFPDFASTPYAEYVDHDQYLHQLHVIGMGDYEVHQIRIEDTPIASFAEIQAQVILPGGFNTLFNHDVVTAPEVAGQELIALADTGGSLVGPFTVNPPQTQVSHIGIDVLMLRGLYYANDDGSLSPKAVQWRVEVRLVDDAGEAVSGWWVLAEVEHSAASGEAQRLSYKYAVAPGRYQVRLSRLDSKDPSSRAGHELRWGEVRGYLAGASLPQHMTLLALRMKATDNLSQRSSRLVNCLVTRKLPTWSPQSGWSSPVPTRSIAWAFADALRAEYGAGLADARIDLQSLYRLDEQWATRGDLFDAVFDQGLTVWETLGRIARCGRAVPFLQGGIVRIVRDEPKTLPVALFSMRNIVRGSLKIQYVMPGEETADTVVMGYLNPKTWKPDEVTVNLPGADGTRQAKVTLFGCSSHAQAVREGKYIAAANRYRRRLITFTTEMEGLIPTYGDLIAISHDMPSWGTSGEVLGFELVNRSLVVSEPLPWVQGREHQLVLRMPEGSLAGPFQVTRGGSDQHAVVPVSAWPDLTGAMDSGRPLFTFGAGQDWSQLARVMSLRPRGEQVEITCVAEDAAVHSADLA